MNSHQTNKKTNGVWSASDNAIATFTNNDNDYYNDRRDWFEALNICASVLRWSGR